MRGRKSQKHYFRLACLGYHGIKHSLKRGKEEKASMGILNGRIGNSKVYKIMHIFNYLLLHLWQHLAGGSISAVYYDQFVSGKRLCSFPVINQQFVVLYCSRIFLFTCTLYKKGA